MLEAFDYPEYERLLTGLADGRLNLTFGDIGSGELPKAFFLLRHDIDFCPDSALRMAELEAQRGVRATYFLLFSSPYYNLLDLDHRAFPRRLADLGHEVGLHYDSAAYHATGAKDPSSVLLAEAALLDTLSGQRVSSIAAHNPSLNGRDPLTATGSFVDAYDTAFADDILYLSDSCGAWRDDAVLALAAAPFPPRLQLLVHPVFWGPQHRHRSSALASLGERRKAEIDRWMRITTDIWLAHDGVRQHEARQPSG